MKPNIAIDGVAGSGKGITAKGVAKKLGYKYIDTGSMYRALARYLLENNIKLEKNQILAELPKVKIDLDESQKVFLNGKDITDFIRTTKVSGAIPYFANIKKVRQRMVKQQKKLGLNGGVVMEGRDIGSVVLPDAKVKVFLTADLEVRAKRRLYDQQKKDNTITLEKIIENMQKRDDADWRQLKILFEKYNKTVTVIDTTNCSINEQINEIINLSENYF